MKRRVFSLIDPRWTPFFRAEPSKIDWRLVEWGGVLIDDRRDGSPGVPCHSCIPALDDPPVTDAAEAGTMRAPFFRWVMWTSVSPFRSGFSG